MTDAEQIMKDRNGAAAAAMVHEISIGFVVPTDRAVGVHFVVVEPEQRSEAFAGLREHEVAISDRDSRRLLEALADRYGIGLIELGR